MLERSVDALSSKARLCILIRFYTELMMCSFSCTYGGFVGMMILFTGSL